MTILFATAGSWAADFIDYKVRGSKCKHIFHIKYCRDILDLNGIPSLTTLVYRLNVIIY